MYDRMSGYRGNINSDPLTAEQLHQIESVLASPHNPAAQEMLYLKGESKLRLEAAAAKRNKRLYVLNRHSGVPDRWQKLSQDTCLIEQDPGMQKAVGEQIFKKVIILDRLQKDSARVERKLTALRGLDRQPSSKRSGMSGVQQDLEGQMLKSSSRNF